MKIKFLNDDGSLTELPQELDLKPVIEIELDYITSDGLATSKALALIDTGADHRVIDKSFAESLVLNPAGTCTTSGVGGFVKDVHYYQINYKIKTNGGIKVLQGAFVAPSLAETGRKYQVILGMSFLQKGRLIMDAQTHDYFFEFSS
ncbi:retroviral-like aspartic protease [Pseudomonas fulva]|uniref:retropepsin-like aspartic protease n=1 Tax=Pseudomonas fulva TaxID=47880 RepID=UPI0018AA63B7|nr:retropepsin-like aspartic protease [Pseudomonas fulva]MBF8674808.1 retroviral-like aspartic protease [Pseudomonas fulva]MBF8696633.1 retroviral-like aspartic protease [Pseudomonas fulva]